MMTSTDLHGFVPAIVTPFNERGEIMDDAFVEIFEWLIQRGASSICIAGDNGESWTLSAQERGHLTALAAQASKGRVHIITGCSAPTLKASLEYAHAAEENGADALLSMPQTYVLKTTQEELTGRFEQLSAQTPLPLILYNSPRRAGLSLTSAQIGSILDIAPIIGIKESHRDFFHHTHLIESYRDRMSILIGPCHYIMPGIALGAVGFIATGPEFIDLNPNLIAGIAQSTPGDEYRRLHYQLTVLYELLMGTSTWPASFKAALNLLGLPAGVPRDPVYPATAMDVDKIRACFDHLGISYH